MCKLIKNDSHISCVNILGMYLLSDPHVWCCAQEPGPVSMETGSRRRDGHTSKIRKKACAQLSESSESSDSLSEYLQSNVKSVV